MNRLTIEIITCIVLSVGFYLFGVNNEAIKWELKFKTEQEKQLKEFITKIQVQATHTQNVLNESKAKEQQSWELYKNAEENYTNAMSDNDTLRVRIKKCTSTNSTGNMYNTSSSSSVGNGANEEQAELPDSVKRSLTEIGYRADKCEAKLIALQSYIGTLNNTCLVTKDKE